MSRRNRARRRRKLLKDSCLSARLPGYLNWLRDSLTRTLPARISCLSLYDVLVFIIYASGTTAATTASAILVFLVFCCCLFLSCPERILRSSITMPCQSYREIHSASHALRCRERIPRPFGRLAGCSKFILTPHQDRMKRLGSRSESIGFVFLRNVARVRIPDSVVRGMIVLFTFVRWSDSTDELLVTPDLTPTAWVINLLRRNDRTIRL